jgi:hypothetical protein
MCWLHNAEAIAHHLCIAAGEPILSAFAAETD